MGIKETKKSLLITKKGRFSSRWSQGTHDLPVGSEIGKLFFLQGSWNGPDVTLFQPEGDIKWLTT